MEVEVDTVKFFRKGDRHVEVEDNRHVCRLSSGFTPFVDDEVKNTKNDWRKHMVLFSSWHCLLRITPMQMQDKTKGTQAKQAERVKSLHKQLHVLFP